MAQTTTSDVFDPEVWADMAQAEFLGKTRVLNSGAVVSDNTLESGPGSSIEFPKWGTLDELEKLDEGEAMTPEAMTSSSSKATVEEYGKAVEITDSAKLYGIGDPEAEARRQFGVLAARSLDQSLVDVAVASGAYSSERSGSLSWEAIVDGIAQFGDDWDPEDFAGLFIRSDAQAEVFVDDQFINASKLGGDTPVLRGQIGVIGGLSVFVTDRLPSDTSVILKRNALGALYKRRPQVEQDRDILARTNVITTNVHYATKRLDDKGVCTLTIESAG